ncbi:MAG: hypothetical protein HC889_15525 [Synechococcaceae cyanobacterium SM1_2_3]|nr:hypothetical protein [Synechococcaceae cyanobacterium SM1_2_3]
MPVPFTATQIKAWFETADLPTQQQFADLVDTMFYMIQQANDTAAAAVATADAAAASVSTCEGFFRVDFANSTGTNPTAATVTEFREHGCTFAVTNLGWTTTVANSGDLSEGYLRFQVDVTFDSAMADTDYTSNFELLSKTVNSCAFYFDFRMTEVKSTGGTTPVFWGKNWADVAFHIWA